MITLLIPGDTPRPLWKKLNPIWWLGNDEASAQGNTFAYKYLRNIAQNFRWYVIGFADQPHTVTGREGNPGTIPNKRSDMRPAESGWQYSYIHPFFPFVSYSSAHLTFYIGWEPRGGFGLLFNTSNSDLK
jgi:hypothetical protein